jgi:predicted RNase H-like nuclease
MATYKKTFKNAIDRTYQRVVLSYSADRDIALSSQEVEDACSLLKYWVEKQEEALAYIDVPYIKTRKTGERIVQVETARGRTAEAIAKLLNQYGVENPHGKSWTERTVAYTRRNIRKAAAENLKKAISQASGNNLFSQRLSTQMDLAEKLWE